MNNQKKLLDFLLNESHPLDHRLKTALQKFTCVDTHIVEHRETILTWLKCNLDKNNDSRDRKLILAVVKHCVGALNDVLLSPRLTDPILTLFLQENQHEPEFLECSKEILKNTHFLKYLVHHIQKFSEIITFCVSQVKSSDLKNDDTNALYDVILKSILYIHEHSLQDNELKLVFVESLVKPLAYMAFEIKSRSRQDFHSLPFQDVFYKVLFSDNEFRKAFASDILKNNAEDKLVVNVINVIRNYPTHFDSEILKYAYSLIFRSFLSSTAVPNAKFRVFLALNSFIYMRPVALDDENSKCVMLKENVLTSNELIELLLNYDIPLDSKAQTVTLMDWLKVLIDVILNEVKNNFTPAIIRMLKNTLSFSPLLIENCLRKFTKTVMLLRKSDPQVLQIYSELCLHVLNVHVKLNRMHKLISALLITVKENLDVITLEELPRKFDVLPQEIFDHVQSAVMNLPSTVQNVALLNALLYHLENDCILVLEKQNSKEVGTKYVLLFDIVSYLICRYISGTRIMDYSVPDMVKEKFILLMDNLGVLLGKFGKVIISKEHVPDLVECFLYLCSVWGDMQIVFMTYESTPRKVAKQVGATGNAATNLIYLHPYLSDYHWNLIAQRVANFGNENCIIQLNNLVLQKIHALPYVEDEIQGPYEENIYGDGPAIVCAHFLSNQTNMKWISHHVSEFVHLLKPVDILKLSKALVNYCQMCDEDEISRIINSNFREMRPLVLAMLNYTFHNLSKNLAKINLKELKRILRRVDYEEMMEVEMGEEEESVASLNTRLDEVGVLLSDNFGFVEAEADFNPITRDVNFLLKLPAQYLRKENKTMICLFTMSLTKSLIKLRKNESYSWRTFENLVKFLQSLLTDVRLPETLDCGKILVWFYGGLKNLPCCDLMMRRLCEAQPNYGSAVDSVIEIVKTAVGGHSPNDVFLESYNEGVDLVSSYLVSFEKARKRKNDSGCEVKEKMKKLCYKNLDKVFCSTTEDSDDRHRKQLALYTLLLHEALQSKDMVHVRQLASHLEEFINFVQENSDSTSEEVSRFLLLVLSYKKELKPYLTDNFLLDLWCCRWSMSEDAVIKAFLTRASVEEYKEMIYLLLTHTEGSLNEPESSQLRVLSNLWKLTVNTEVKAKKTRLKKYAISELSVLAQNYSILEESSHTTIINRMFIQIFTAVLQNTEIPLRYQTIDLCFDFISSCVNTNLADELIIDCVEMLFVFCLLWKSLLLDRIPAFYLCYKSLFAAIARRGVHSEHSIEELSCAAHKLEKLTDNLVKSKKDFAKTAISAVSDFISMMVEVDVENRLQNHLKNIIYCWIGMCDTHGLQYLSTVMMPVAQNLFKQYRTEYTKYYKFSGKV